MAYLRKNIGFIIAFFLMVTLLGISIYFSFIDKALLDITSADIRDIRREEIQRYFGYEDLLNRYLTIPYDISLNTNQPGTYVDIGFIFIICLPFILLALVKNASGRIAIIFTSLVFLTISIGNSFINVDGNKIGVLALSELENSSDLRMTNLILLPVYSLFGGIYEVINPLFKMIGGEKDFVTYPIFLSILLFMLFLIYRTSSSISGASKILMLATFVYSMFFFFFSSGIIWYGYFLIFLCLLGLCYFLFRSDQEEVKSNPIIHFSCIVVIIAWIGLGLVSRISNFQVNLPLQHQGKFLLVPDVYMFNTGKLKTKEDLLNKTSSNLAGVFEMINSNHSERIFKVGTGFTYFIEKNDRRVMHDNQLGVIYELIRKYEFRSVVSDVLKASGFKYIIVDLDTPSLDYTPERSLTRKFNTLMEYLKNNETVRLLSTDNKVRYPGEVEDEYGMNKELTTFKGSYAIYELI